MKLSFLLDKNEKNEMQNLDFMATPDRRSLNSILRLSGSSWTWSNVGQLNSVRHGHGVILVGNKFMILGGYNAIFKNEACSLENEQFTCTELSSSLSKYSYMPILHLVDENYGTC